MIKICTCSLTFLKSVRMYNLHFDFCIDGFAILCLHSYFLQLLQSNYNNKSNILIDLKNVWIEMEKHSFLQYFTCNKIFFSSIKCFIFQQNDFQFNRDILVLYAFLVLPKRFSVTNMFLFNLLIFTLINHHIQN